MSNILHHYWQCPRCLKRHEIPADWKIAQIPFCRDCNKVMLPDLSYPFNGSSEDLRRLVEYAGYDWDEYMASPKPANQATLDNYKKAREALEALRKQTPASPHPTAPMGWICPVCGRGLSPWTTTCPCVAHFPPAPPPWTLGPGTTGDPLPPQPITVCEIKV